MEYFYNIYDKNHQTFDWHSNAQDYNCFNCMYTTKQSHVDM